MRRAVSFCYSLRAMTAARDVHSYSDPARVRVRHADLDLDVRFDRRILEGTATLTIERVDPAASSLVLDTRGLDVSGVEAGIGETFAPTRFEVGAADAILGAPLTIALPAGADRVRVRYATRPGASGLQWLDPPPDRGQEAPLPLLAVRRRSTRAAGSRSRTRRGSGSRTTRRSGRRPSSSP